MVEARRRLKEVLAESGGVPGSTRSAGYIGSPIQSPFASAVPVEGTEIAAVHVSGRVAESLDAAFADGIQRFVVEGWIGMTPILRAYVAAAVLYRHDRVLSPVNHAAREFIVAPLDRLPAAVVAGLRATGLPVHDSGMAEREHPLLDVQDAVREIERERRRLEVATVSDFRRSSPDPWIVVDGSLRPFAHELRASRALGVIKSHETQYFAGVDLETALTLPEGHRTTVFRRVGAEEHILYSWYLRLWDWRGQDILHGLLRIEREQGRHVINEVDEICRWLLAERAPISAPDGRWDRLLYPIREVENFLRAKAGSWC